MLRCAIVRGHLDIVEHAYGYGGMTDDACDIICLATAHGQHDIVAGFVDRASSLDTFSAPLEGTALHYAAMFGLDKIAKLLLMRKASTEVRAKKTHHPYPNVSLFTLIPLDNGVTPLHLAAAYGHLSTVRLLLEFGAQINASCPYDKHQQTALYFAVVNSNTCMAELLLAHKATPNFVCNSILSSSLHVAANHNKPELIRMLVKAGAAVEAQNSEVYG